MKYMTKNKLLLVFLLLSVSCMGFGQGFSNKGTDFWIPYPVHINGTSSVMGLYITSDVNATGTVTVGSQTLSFTVTANTVTEKFLGPSSCTTCNASNTSVYLSQTDGIATGAAIHITSDKPVVVYAHIIFSARSGATLVLPSTVWGKQYIVPSYSSIPAPASQGYTGYGTITVLASDANTVVKITPSAATLSGKPAGTAYTITLANPGDVYQVQFTQNADISGTLVESQASNGGGCKKIAVFSSTSWSAFGCSNAGSGDNLFQQLFPVASWGKNFLTAPGRTRKYDIIRVFVADPTTQVSKTENGVTTTLTGLVNNSFYEYSTGNPTFISSDKPASVVQYFTTAACQNAASTQGDPEMIVLNPVEQTINNITVFSAHKSWVPLNQSNIDSCYLNIIIKSNSTASFKINNVAPSSSFIAIPGTAFSYLQENVTAITLSNPVQNLKADSSFIAIAYGFGMVESYGYNAGTNVQDFTQVASLQNPYKRIDSAVTCINTPFQFAVPLNFVPVSIKWDFSAAPNISPNTTVTPMPVAYDSVNQNTGLYYYSPHTTYTFLNTNTSALRDTIKLYTTSSTPDGCGSTSQVYTIPVSVNNKPVAKFLYTSSGCVSDSVLLTDQSTNSSGLLNQWLWDFGDGTSDNRLSATPFSKKYAAGGNYPVKLKVVSDIGCASDSVVQTIPISDKPVAKFTYQSITCVNNDIVFTDASSTSSGTITKWTWNLDDGAGSFTNTTNTSPKTQYAIYGSKNPVLSVETSTGCKSDPFTIPLKVNPLPNVGFISPAVCLNDANAPFTDTTTIAEGSLVSYLWNFNAGSPAITPGPVPISSTLQNPQVKYNKSDNYKVSLTVSSAAGCAATKIQDFTVNGTNPRASFRFANAAPYCGTKAIQLQNTSTVDFGNVTKLEIYWDLVGSPSVKQVDQSPSPNKIYPYSYTNPSVPTNYKVKLLAYSGGTSCVDSTIQTITVYPQPKAAFTVSASQLCYGQTVSFTDKSYTGSSAATTWAWNLADGDVSTVQNPVKQFNDSGLLTTSMYFYNADGCISDTASQQLTVYPNPKLTLTHNVTVLSGGTTTLVPLYVYGNQLQYLWTPATYLSSDTSTMPKTVPSDDITYRLTLTAQGGCSVSDTVFVKVLKGPEVPNAFSPNGDGINDTWRIKYLESYPGATVEVYNRYGQIVYRSVGYSVDWDGTYNGRPLPVATYYYIINPRNGREVITGSVTIIK
jgi:gliding motility-associated-like protein